MAEMSEVYAWATGHAIVHPMSKMSEMSTMAARHAIVHSLESSAV
jgi:hypothetical protein